MADIQSLVDQFPSLTLQTSTSKNTALRIIINSIRRFIQNKWQLTPSKKQSAKWRTQQSWYSNGKSNECELYQLNQIRRITNLPTAKTNLRINMENNKIVPQSCPLKKTNGFEYTEDFDGIIVTTRLKLYFNLKFVCGSGGAQTRSLREVYHFVKAQMKYCLRNPNSYRYFINILDGDMSYQSMDKFQYLLDHDEYALIRDRIFIGDMVAFNAYWNTTIANILPVKAH